jgi:hypothetical protein
MTERGRHGRMQPALGRPASEQVHAAPAELARAPAASTSPISYPGRPSRAARTASRACRQRAFTVRGEQSSRPAIVR